MSVETTSVGFAIRWTLASTELRTRFARARGVLRFVGLVSLMLIAPASASPAHARTPRITGLFTDIHLIPEVGDVLGTSLEIVYRQGKYWGTVRIAEGALEPPEVVPLEVVGSRVRFTYRVHVLNPDGTPADDVILNFDGTVSDAALSGVFGSERVVLKRAAASGSKAGKRPR